jgi:hypothetical protein
VVDVAQLEPILDPTGDDERTTDLTLAPRLRSLDGLKIGLLENGKTNAALLLTEVAKQLQNSHGAASWRLYKKGYFGTPAEEKEIAQIREECDLAIAAIGD